MPCHGGMPTAAVELFGKGFGGCSRKGADPRKAPVSRCVIQRMCVISQPEKKPATCNTCPRTRTQTHTHRKKPHTQRHKQPASTPTRTRTHARTRACMHRCTHSHSVDIRATHRVGAARNETGVRCRPRRRCLVVGEIGREIADEELAALGVRLGLRKQTHTRTNGRTSARLQRAQLACNKRRVYAACASACLETETHL